MQRHAGEYAESKQDEQGADKEVAGTEGGADHEEFTLKEAEWRHTDHRHCAQAKRGAAEGKDAQNAALDLLEKVGLEALIDIAGGQEEQRFPHRVKRHV